jgi:hypothetical protein
MMLGWITGLHCAHAGPPSAGATSSPQPLAAMRASTVVRQGGTTSSAISGMLTAQAVLPGGLLCLQHARAYPSSCSALHHTLPTGSEGLPPVIPAPVQGVLKIGPPATAVVGEGVQGQAASCPHNDTVPVVAVALPPCEILTANNEINR